LSGRAEAARRFCRDQTSATSGSILKPLSRELNPGDCALRVDEARDPR